MSPAPEAVGFPPAFDHNPYSYAFALFALICLCAISSGAVVNKVRELDPHEDGYTSPITLSRLRMLLYCLTLVSLTLGDVLVLLVWGEVSNRAMENLWAFDRMLDALSLIPFLGATAITIRGGPVIDYALKADISPPTDIWPTWKKVKDQLVLLGATAGIAAGVAVGKM